MERSKNIEGFRPRRCYHRNMDPSHVERQLQIEICKEVAIMSIAIPFLTKEQVYLRVLNKLGLKSANVTSKTKLVKKNNKRLDYRKLSVYIPRPSPSNAKEKHEARSMESPRIIRKRLLGRSQPLRIIDQRTPLPSSQESDNSYQFATPSPIQKPMKFKSLKPPRELSSTKRTPRRRLFAHAAGDVDWRLEKNSVDDGDSPAGRTVGKGKPDSAPRRAAHATTPTGRDEYERIFQKAKRLEPTLNGRDSSNDRPNVSPAGRTDDKGKPDSAPPRAVHATTPTGSDEYERIFRKAKRIEQTLNGGDSCNARPNKRLRSPSIIDDAADRLVTDVSKKRVSIKERARIANAGTLGENDQRETNPYTENTAREQVSVITASARSSDREDSIPPTTAVNLAQIMLGPVTPSPRESLRTTGRISLEAPAEVRSSEKETPAVKNKVNRRSLSLSSRTKSSPIGGNPAKSTGINPGQFDSRAKIPSKGKNIDTYVQIHAGKSTAGENDQVMDTNDTADSRHEGVPEREAWAKLDHLQTRNRINEKEVATVVPALRTNEEDRRTVEGMEMGGGTDAHEQRPVSEDQEVPMVQEYSREETVDSAPPVHQSVQNPSPSQDADDRLSEDDGAADQRNSKDKVKSLEDSIGNAAPPLQKSAENLRPTVIIEEMDIDEEAVDVFSSLASPPNQETKSQSDDEEDYMEIEIQTARVSPVLSGERLNKPPTTPEDRMACEYESLSLAKVSLSGGTPTAVAPKKQVYQPSTNTSPEVTSPLLGSAIRTSRRLTRRTSIVADESRDTAAQPETPSDAAGTPASKSSSKVQFQETCSSSITPRSSASSTDLSDPGRVRSRSPSQFVISSAVSRATSAYISPPSGNSRVTSGISTSISQDMPISKSASVERALSQVSSIIPCSVSYKEQDSLQSILLRKRLAARSTITPPGTGSSSDKSNKTLLSSFVNSSSSPFRFITASAVSRRTSAHISPTAGSSRVTSGISTSISQDMPISKSASVETALSQVSSIIPCSVSYKEQDSLQSILRRKRLAARSTKTPPSTGSSSDKSNKTLPSSSVNSSSSPFQFITASAASRRTSVHISSTGSSRMSGGTSSPVLRDVDNSQSPSVKQTLSHISSSGATHCSPSDEEKDPLQSVLNRKCLTARPNNKTAPNSRSSSEKSPSSSATTVLTEYTPAPKASSACKSSMLSNPSQEPSLKRAVGARKDKEAESCSSRRNASVSETPTSSNLDASFSGRKKGLPMISQFPADRTWSSRRVLFADDDQDDLFASSSIPENTATEPGIVEEEDLPISDEENTICESPLQHHAHIVSLLQDRFASQLKQRKKSSSSARLSQDSTSPAELLFKLRMSSSPTVQVSPLLLSKGADKLDGLPFQSGEAVRPEANEWLRRKNEGSQTSPSDYESFVQNLENVSSPSFRSGTTARSQMKQKSSISPESVPESDVHDQSATHRKEKGRGQRCVRPVNKLIVRRGTLVRASKKVDLKHEKSVRPTQKMVVRRSSVKDKPADVSSSLEKPSEPFSCSFPSGNGSRTRNESPKMAQLSQLSNSSGKWWIEVPDVVTGLSELTTFEQRPKRKQGATQSSVQRSLL